MLSWSGDTEGDGGSERFGLLLMRDISIIKLISKYVKMAIHAVTQIPLIQEDLPPCTISIENADISHISAIQQPPQCKGYIPLPVNTEMGPSPPSLCVLYKHQAH